VTQGIYHFYWDWGRSGHLEGWFLSDDQTVQSVLGQRVNFGEVLGKHSEVCGNLSQGDIRLVTNSPDLVSAFQRIIQLSERNYEKPNCVSIGYNPLDYIRYICSLCDQDYHFVTERDKLMSCCDEHYCQTCLPKHNQRHHPDEIDALLKTKGK